MFPNQKYLHKSTASFVRRKAFRVPGYLVLEHMSNLGKGPDNQIRYEAFTLLALQLSVNVVIHPLLYIIRVNYSGSGPLLIAILVQMACQCLTLSSKQSLSQMLYLFLHQER